MTDRGMIMSPHNVRAIERLLKTQTRRVLDPQPEVSCDEDGIDILEFYDKKYNTVLKLMKPLDQEAQEIAVKKLSYYQPGDKVYIKQRWRVFRALNLAELEEQRKFRLLLDYGNLVTSQMWTDCSRDDFMKYAHDGSWKNPRFMPKWASRLSLEILDVRLQRLGDMTTEDCYAEGCRANYGEQVLAMGDALLRGRENHLWDNKPTLENFQWFWNLINGETHPYDPALWVWAIRFKPVFKEKKE